MRHWGALSGGLLALALALPAAVRADDSAPSCGAGQQAAAGRIEVVGQGRVTRAPDEARITVGIEALAPTADRAMRAASARMGKVMAALERLRVAPEDVQTREVSLAPRFERYDGGREDLQIAGFTARNLLEIRVRRLERLGAILDAVVAAGANRIHGIAFTLSDPAPAEAQARRQAVRDALARARDLAGAAGLAAGPVLEIAELGGGAPAPRVQMLARAEGAPVAPGTLDVIASVRAVIALCPSGG